MRQFLLFYYFFALRLWLFEVLKFESQLSRFLSKLSLKPKSSHESRFLLSFFKDNFSLQSCFKRLIKKTKNDKAKSLQCKTSQNSRVSLINLYPSFFFSGPFVYFSLYSIYPKNSFRKCFLKTQRSFLAFCDCCHAPSHTSYATFYFCLSSVRTKRHFSASAEAKYSAT